MRKHNARRNRPRFILKVTVEAPNTAKFDKDSKKSAESIDKITDSAMKSSKSVAEIAKQMDEARKKIQDDAIKVGDSLRTAGEGAFTMARGIALAGVSGEDDLKKVIESVAKVQASFDVFKGTLDIVKGLTEGTRALKTASAAAAVGETALAGANTAVATTGAAAAVSMKALLVSFGPIAVALAAAAAVYTLLIRKTKELSEATDTTTTSFDRQQRRLSEIDDELETVGKRSTLTANIIGRGQIDSFQLTKLHREELYRLNDTFKESLQRSVGFIGVFREKPKTLEELKDLSALLVKQIKPSFGLDKIDTRKIDKLTRLRRAEIAVLKGAAIARNLKSDLNQQAGLIEHQLLLGKDITQALSVQRTINDAILRQQKEKVDLKTIEIADPKTLKSLAEKELKTARDRLKADLDRVSALKQTIGAMDAVEIQCLKNAFERVKKAGVANATRADLLRIQPIDPKLAGKGFEARFAKLAGADFLKDIKCGLDPKILRQADIAENTFVVRVAKSRLARRCRQAFPSIRPVRG